MHRLGAMLLIVRECSGFISRWFSTIVEVDVQDREPVESGEKVGARGERERKKTKRE